MRNWAGNVRFEAAGLLRPGSVAELQAVVARERRLRPLGTGHSFSPIADTTGYLVSLAGLPPVTDIDSERGTVRVSAGLRYSDVAPRLHAAGLALPNLGSLPHISVAGAVATGTHGSGDANGSLATAVAGLELVTASGDLVSVSRGADPARLSGLVVSLGACGIVTALTLDTVPAFDVRQYVYRDVAFSAVAGHFDEVTGSGYSVSMFTDWTADRFTGIWVKLTGQRPPPPDWLGGRLSRADLHVIAGMPAANCTPQLGVPGPWHERLPHFRADFTPSAGAELQSEYLVAREHAVAALAALAAIRAELAPVILVSELRTVAADELWLSPAYQRDSAAFHFTWVPDTEKVLPLLASVEAALAPFAARPHWGKIFAVPPDQLARVSPRLADFRRVVHEFDPAGKFSNPMLDSVLLGSGRKHSGPG
jgi:xylitol oxidase